ncbi:hypothetical protein H6F90_10950 [Trichocoleus sp. FACHB-591]|uniref:hypothetical protein n=1 Tax=Trichocoleus sp. FACHB-591 TaxID=2692872 RepID=UPI001684DCA5|nr:hypothetical protein [Trichocoleus sp. FACHB-591]MBD2095672.1 hypothetical protein [Trichocoleus sp. FACHB-591]
MTNYEQRQYQLMKAFIQDFESGNMTIKTLISSLDGLLSAVEFTDKPSKEALRSEWWTLEQVYAVALDREETELSPESQVLVVETLENIKVLLQQLITS